MNVMLSRRTMLRLSAGAATAAMIGIAGCARQTTVLTPPHIHYGYDTCAWCGMIINDPHFAAAVAYSRNGIPHDVRFDDIGCMLAWQKTHQEKQVLRVWVKNYTTEKWMEALKARFVQSRAIITPMASGIAAGATPGQAKLAIPQSVRAGYETMDYSAIRHLKTGKNNNADGK